MFTSNASPVDQPVRTGSNSARATHGMVASVDPLATEAGVNILKHGGNAIDAAAAVGLTLGVVNGHNSGIGGGCFILIRRADGSFIAIDGRETAPVAATRDMYVRGGKADTELSQVGALASGVPGALAAYEFAVTRYGRKKFKDLILPAARMAEEGFVLSADYAAKIKRAADKLARFEGSRAVFFKADGKVLGKGERLKQVDLAATYRLIAEQGSEWFYRGPFAQAVEAWMKKNGGILTAQDFRDYEIHSREPISTKYRDCEIITVSPPSSGGVQVIQLLNILENFDLKALGKDRATLLHVVGEAMKLSFADRTYWPGDPDFVKVPRGLVDKKYAAELARKINQERVTAVTSHGTPPDSERDFFGKHTTHFSVADEEGNWVACTATVNTAFGSKVVIPGTGVIMNNEMDDFSIQPGVSNFFGLIGAEANAIAPGKRPISNMSPTIVLKEGKPVIALGAAGGPKIVSQVVLNLVGILDLGMTPAEALAQPRIHHQWFPNELWIEETLPAGLRVALEQRGHKLKLTPSAEMGVSQIVARSPDGKSFVGAADPRVSGKAAGW